MKINLSAQSKQLDRKIKTIQRQLSKLPKGTLHISRQGDQYYYRHKTPDGNIRYIAKKDLSLARNLAFRKYLELQLEELEACLQATLSYTQIMAKVENQAEQYLMKNEGAGRLLRNHFPVQNAPLAAWSARPESTSASNQDRRILTCRSGHRVRSKTEGMIDQALFVARIPFRYEDPLTLGQNTLHPDFTIRHPVTGTYYYWEHFGLMDVPSYARDAVEKLALYARHGIIPFHHLIITCETNDHPLSYEQIDLLISYYFHCQI